MPQPLDTRFAEFLQALTADYYQQAYDFKAFARARKIKSALQLLQLVLKSKPRRLGCRAFWQYFHSLLRLYTLQI